MSEPADGTAASESGQPQSTAPGELVDCAKRILDALPPPTASDYAALLARYSEAQREWEAAIPVDQADAAERMHAAWRELARARNARLGGVL